jgi:hypothetical protein
MFKSLSFILFILCSVSYAEIGTGMSGDFGKKIDRNVQTIISMHPIAGMFVDKDKINKPELNRNDEAIAQGKTAADFYKEQEEYQKQKALKEQEADEKQKEYEMNNTFSKKFELFINNIYLFIINFIKSF